MGAVRDQAGTFQGAMDETRAQPTSRIRRAKLLQPRLSLGLLPRPRLVTLLNEGLRHSLILVTAPAGYGKTTLLAQWLEPAFAQTAWLSLDQEDADLSTFVSYMVAAIQTVIPNAGRATLGLLRMPMLPPPDILATELGDELLDLGEDLVLVLEDYHTIGNEDVHQFVSTLLQYPPPRLRLVISSRADPPFPLTRYRTRGLLAEVRAADLRFTLEETGTLLHGTVHDDLDAMTVAMLQNQTEGWITGLRLALLAWHDRRDSSQIAKALEVGAGRSVMELLGEEVIKGQSAETREFLIHTAVPDRLCASLCNFLLESPTGNEESQTTLERLEHSGLFLTQVGDDGTWFRYHHLFQDLLRRLLAERTGAHGVRAQHARVSTWFEEHGFIEEAIRHALAAGQPARAAHLVVQNAQRALVEDQWLTVERWLSLQTPEQINVQAELLINRAWILLNRGHYDDMHAILDRARAVLALSDQEDRDALLAEIEAMRVPAWILDDHIQETVAITTHAVDLIFDAERFASGFALFWLGQALAMDGQSQTAIERLSTAIAAGIGQTDIFSVQRTLWAQFSLGLILLQNADLSSCRRTAEEMLALATAHQMGKSAAAARFMLGIVAYERNRIDDAIAFLAAVVDERQANVLVLHSSMLGLALALQAAGRDDEAEKTLDTLLDLALDTESTRLLPPIRSLRARLALLRGELHPAMRWLTSFSVSLHDESMVAVEIPAITRARTLIAEGSAGSLAEALRALAQTLQLAESTRTPWRSIEVLALQAITLQHLGRSDEALDALRRSLSLAEAGRFIRIFIDAGPTMASLLRELAVREGPAPYLDRLLMVHPHLADHQMPSGDPRPLLKLDRIEPRMTDAAGPLVEKLTERELEVLEALHRRLSNKEIAAELGISPLTVKRHATNIYGKLGVASRRQAIRQAAAYGLVSAN